MRFKKDIQTFEKTLQFGRRTRYGSHGFGIKPLDSIVNIDVKLLIDYVFNYDCFFRSLLAQLIVVFGNTALPCSNKHQCIYSRFLNQ